MLLVCLQIEIGASQHIEGSKRRSMSSSDDDSSESSSEKNGAEQADDSDSTASSSSSSSDDSSSSSSSDDSNSDGSSSESGTSGGSGDDSSDGDSSSDGSSSDDNSDGNSNEEQEPSGQESEEEPEEEPQQVFHIKRRPISLAQLDLAVHDPSIVHNLQLGDPALSSDPNRSEPSAPNDGKALCVTQGEANKDAGKTTVIHIDIDGDSARQQHERKASQLEMNAWFTSNNYMDIRSQQNVMFADDRLKEGNALLASNPQKAKSVFQEGLDLVPSHVGLLVAIGRALIQQQQQNQAPQRQHQRLHGRDSNINYSNMYHREGRVERQQQRDSAAVKAARQSARKHFHQALKLEPDCADAKLEMERLDELIEAEEEWKRQQLEQKQKQQKLQQQQRLQQSRYKPTTEIACDSAAYQDAMMERSLLFGDPVNGSVHDDNDDENQRDDETDTRERRKSKTKRKRKKRKSNKSKRRSSKSNKKKKRKRRHHSSSDSSSSESQGSDDTTSSSDDDDSEPSSSSDEEERERRHRRKKRKRRESNRRR